MNRLTRSAILAYAGILLIAASFGLTDDMSTRANVAVVLGAVGVGLVIHHIGRIDADRRIDNVLVGRLNADLRAADAKQRERTGSEVIADHMAQGTPCDGWHDEACPNRVDDKYLKQRRGIEPARHGDALDLIDHDRIPGIGSDEDLRREAQELVDEAAGHDDGTRYSDPDDGAPQMEQDAAREGELLAEAGFTPETPAGPPTRACGRCKAIAALTDGLCRSCRQLTPAVA